MSGRSEESYRGIFFLPALLLLFPSSDVGGVAAVTGSTSQTASQSPRRAPSLMVTTSKMVGRPRRIRASSYREHTDRHVKSESVAYDAGGFRERNMEA